MELVNSIKTLQADVFTMYTQVHGYHWNVEGVLFTQYHSFFEEIYEDVYGSIDPISENLRKLNVPAPFKLEDLISNRTITDVSSSNSPKDMVEKLIESNDIVIRDLNDVFAKATAANEQGICNFIADRLDKHKFWNWWLTSSLKSSIN
jgi:starvation-inducible DNA-binding protein